MPELQLVGTTMWASLLIHLALSNAVLSGVRQPDATDSTRQSAWLHDWEAEEGFAILIDTDGFSLPAAIAFVPDADTASDAPLYFVAELRGTIKVVTRDRRVHVFADNLIPRPPAAELPAEQGETGLAGLCLAPRQGYLFATLAYRDSSGTIRNSLLRFTSTPYRYGLSPTATQILDAPFAGSRAAPSHQIGPCQVQGSLLYVSVGDGMQMAASQDVRAPLGKILRMTLDGRPAPGNPFPTAGGAGPYVWAYGLRNPFSLRIVGDRVIGADNGPSVDRVVDFTAGQNYLWNGSDWSMATNAVAVFSPSAGPVQLDYVPSGSPALPPPYQDRFYLAMAGLPTAKGPPNRPGAKGIVMVDYDLTARRLRSVPRSVLRYRGSDYQVVAALGVGPDGLYFAGLLPGASGTSPVFKLVHRPDQPHPHLVLEDRDGSDLLYSKGCLGCHARGDRRLGQQGPPLDLPDLAERLERRLNSPEYEQQVATLDAREDEPFARYRTARQDVLAVRGGERARRWMRYRLRDPQFDDPNATMPNLGLTAGQAEALTEFLLSAPPSPERGMGVVARLRDTLPRPRYVFVAGAFAAGIALGAVGVWLLGRRS